VSRTALVPPPEHAGAHAAQRGASHVALRPRSGPTAMPVPGVHLPSVQPVRSGSPRRWALTNRRHFRSDPTRPRRPCVMIAVARPALRTAPPHCSPPGLLGRDLGAVIDAGPGNADSIPHGVLYSTSKFKATAPQGGPEFSGPRLLIRPLFCRSCIRLTY
jgi:hypothetical protein